MNSADYLKLDDLSETDRASIVNSVTDLVLVRMADMIGEELTQEELQELEVISGQGNGETVIEWLNVHIPNFSQGVDEILKEISISLNQNINAILDRLPSADVADSSQYAK